MRLLGPAMLTAGVAVMVAGCTFLIDFNPTATPADSGADSLALPGPPDVSIDGATTPLDGASDAGPDVRDAIANPDACKGNPNGKYCGGNQITWPVAFKDDLITCKSEVVSNVRFCDGLGGCVRMIDGKPDQCDECGSRPPGLYCGRDMGGWEIENHNTLVQCQNSATIKLTPCGAPGCMSKGDASKCN